MTKLYLQNMVEKLSFEELPSEWNGLDLKSFSEKKTLFDYQQNALKNALKALYLYYKKCNGSKEELFKKYQQNAELVGSLVNKLDLKIDSKTAKIFEEFSNDYKIEDNKISFYHFINRMSFWMATGSGKTLVIVKLIEILHRLMKDKQIPELNILFLTHREDLIDQFKKHINEFNQLRINLVNLKDYGKQGNRLKSGNEIDVFYYRSDLISNERKDKIVDFRDYDNYGKWYIILDEAHKGDKQESKRQHLYSILSRNGFLFNFSATFTDEIDFVTCVFNFNLAEFIKNYYGKNIYVSKENISSLGEKSDFATFDKQKILFKIFILQTVINKQYEDLVNIDKNLYHKPLLLTLVNSVNTDDSDLELFFREIENIAAIGKIDEKIFEVAKSELEKELLSEAKYEFEDISIKDLNTGNKISDIIKDITIKDILMSVFNTDTNGEIEILKIPGNQQELIFKMKTSDKPFALMKIGDISSWIKEKLKPTKYEIIEKYDNESIFKNLNQNNDINILMGSRAFYEGWDSNRPNIILFINIGKGEDAKKFVLQAIGRGVRVEPLPNKKGRLSRFKIDDEIYNKIKDKIGFLESLFVFGTKPDNLREVVETLKQEKQDEISIGDLFEINPDVKDKPLIIPVYKLSDSIIAEERDVIKFQINPDDYDLVKNYFNYIGDKIAVVKFDCNISVLNKVKQVFEDKEEKKNLFLYDEDISQIYKPELLLRNIFNHFNNRAEELDKFKNLEEEIIHFKRITVSVKELNSIREKINKVKRVRDKDNIKKNLMEKLERKEITIDEYTSAIEKITRESSEKEVYKELTIELLQNHYYIPVILSKPEKVDYIKHIIKTESEVNFLKDLEEYLKKEDNFFKKFDWWYFSKIDETLDSVYIPYYQPKTNRIEKFKPDFIFWLKKGNQYIILFVDPKGTEHTDAYRKIDGYSRIFEIEKNGQRRSKVFSYGEYNIETKLLLKTKDKAKVLNEYEKYWFDNLDDLMKKI